MIDTITFFKNQATQYDVLHHFRISLSNALIRRHIAVPLVDFSVLDKKGFFQAIYATPPDYTLAFNGLQPFENGTFLCDELEIPHIAWLVDSAHYFEQMAKSPLNILICPDATSAEILKGFGAEQAICLPHAFEASEYSPADSPRDIPLLFCGSLIDPLEIEEHWRQYFKEPLVSHLIQAAEKTLFSASATYQEAYQEVVEAFPDTFALLSRTQISAIATMLDRYVRAKDRIQLLQSLAGLPVHIYGNCLSSRSWGDFLDISKGYQIYPAVNFQEHLGLLKRSQVVLNSSPMFKTGGHERIFYGLGSGAAVLTNKTPWNQEHFTAHELLTYSSGTPGEMRPYLEELLDQKLPLTAMAEKGQKRVMQEHTWDTRASQLLEFLK